MTHSRTLAIPRSDTLPRRLTLLFAAAAIALAALSATARPARADAEDLLRFLAGAVVIAAIVNAIDDNHTPRYYGRYELPDSCLETVRIDWRNIQAYNARCLQRGGYSNLPNRCRHNFRLGGQRTRTGYIAECMWERGYHRGGGYGYHQPRPPRIEDYHRPRDDYRGPRGSRAGILPQHCAMSYREAGRSHSGYWGHCLNDSGIRNLPRQCRRSTRDGAHIYSLSCLTNSGFWSPR